MVIDALLALAALCGLVGAIGLVRLPNFYTRTFASTMCTVGCTCLIVMTLAAKHFYSPLSMKYVVLLLLIMLTSPTASHVIANAAYKNGVDLKGVKKTRGAAK